MAELVQLFQRGVELTARGLRERGYGSLVYAANHFGGLPRLRGLSKLPRPRGGWSAREPRR